MCLDRSQARGVLLSARQCFGGSAQEAVVPVADVGPPLHRSLYVLRLPLAIESPLRSTSYKLRMLRGGRSRYGGLGWLHSFSQRALRGGYRPKGEIRIIDLDAQNRTFEAVGIGEFNGWRQPFCVRAGGTLHRKGPCVPSGGRPVGSGSHAHNVSCPAEIDQAHCRAFPAAPQSHHCDIISGAGCLTTPPDPILPGALTGTHVLGPPTYIRVINSAV